MGTNNGSRRPRLLLVWDAPNISIRSGAAVLTHPKSDDLLSLDRIGAWLAKRADARELTPCATVFVNVSAENMDVHLRFTQAVRSPGFAVHAVPKAQRGDDVDKAMAEHVRQALAARDVGELIVASHDRKAFAGVLAEAAAQGITASVLGHAASATWVDAVRGASFIDLRFVAECLRDRNPRPSFEGLPADGQYFPPLKDLAAAPGVARG